MLSIQAFIVLMHNHCLSPLGFITSGTAVMPTVYYTVVSIYYLFVNYVHAYIQSILKNVIASLKV